MAQATTMTLRIADAHNPNNSKMIEMNRDEMSLDALLRIGQTELKMKEAIKIFSDCGEELTKLSNLNNGDTIYISDGSTLNTAHEVIHLCMLGAGAVGKSALTLQFIQGQFVADYDPTIEDAYRKHIHIDDNPLLLDVLDTAGQEDFVALRTSWMRGRDGFVLVFSVVDHKSFEELQSFYDQLMEVYEENVPPFVLVGNKCDLDPNSIINKNNDNKNNNQISNYQRRVSFEEASELARRWHAVRYIETSAKTGFHVQDMFGGLVRQIISKQFVSQVKPQKAKKSFWDRCQIL